MTQNLHKFHGVWKLVEWSVTHIPSQTTRQPFGGNVDGHIIYTREGWVSATLMEKDRPTLSQDRLALSQLKKHLIQHPEQLLNEEEISQVVPWFLASFGYINYCGLFDVNGQTVHHRIRNSLTPQWVGTTLSRTYIFSNADKQLTLSASQGDTTDQLVWQRE